jgi:hypothetical protein
MGMRLAKISGLVVGNIGRLPTVTRTGTGHRPRQATAGRAIRDPQPPRSVARRLRRARDRWSPVICRQVLGAARQGGSKRIDRTSSLDDPIENAQVHNPQRCSHQRIKPTSH